MPAQLVLSRTAQASGSKVDWVVPSTVRALGKAPDVSVLEPGDVVLFSPYQPKPHQSAIIELQKKSFAAPHARWTHVSIVFDRERIVEAVTPRVSCSTIYSQVVHGKLRVRRAIGLTTRERYRIAIEAMSSIGRRYSVGHAVGMGLKGLLSSYILPKRFQPHEKAIICSQLFTDSYVTVTGKSVVPGKLSDITPADISWTSSLQDVPLGWVPLG